MKTIFKRASKSTLAVVLTLCLLFSCMTVGLIATDAAKTQSESVGALPSKIYFIPNTDWYNSGNVVMKANFNNNGSSWNAVTMTLDDASTRRYSVSVPSNVNKVQFLRGSTGTWSQWDYSNNQTIPTDGKNLFTLNSGWSGTDGTWSTYTPPAAGYTVSTSATHGTAYISKTSTIGNDTSVTYTANGTNTVYVKATPDTGYKFKSWSTTPTSSSTTNGVVTAQFSVNAATTITATFELDTSQTWDIYLKNGANWSAVKAYVYNSDSDRWTDWNGSKTILPTNSTDSSLTVTTTVEDGVYRVTGIPKAYSKIILRDSGSNQTGNNVTLEDGALYNTTGTTKTSNYTPVAPKYYLGYKKNGDQQVEFVNGSASINLDANTTYEFWIKYTTSSGDTYYKNNGTMKRSDCTNWTFATDANNAHITADVAGTYVFTLNTSNGVKVSASYPALTYYNVTIANNISNGTVSASPTSAVEGAEVTLSNNPSAGYKLSSYSVTKDSDGSSVTVTNGKFNMPAGDVTVSATFDLIPYQLGLKLNNVDQGYNNFTNGSVTVSLAANSKYELWIKYDTDYFKDLSGGTHMTRSSCTNWEFQAGTQANTWIDTDLAGEYTFSVSKTRASGDKLYVSVTYPPETNYIVTFAAGAHGTVTPSSASVSNVSGYNLSNVTVTPAAGYKHTGWTVTSGTATISDGKVYPTTACTVAPTYEAVPHVYAVGSKFGNNWALTNTSYEMTYDAASDAYYITMTPVAGEDNYFVFHNASKKYGVQSNTEIGTFSNKSSVSETTANANFYFDFNNGDHISGATYKIWFDLNNMKAWAEVESMNIYLTGWLNGGSVTTTDDSRKFTKQQDGTYTLTYTFTGNQGGAQYVTIFDGTNAYHPATHESGTGTAGTTVNTNPGDDPKWKVAATTDQTVHFTYNPNTKVLSWTVDSLATTYRVVGSATYFGTAWDTTTASSQYKYTLTQQSSSYDGHTYDYKAGPFEANVSYGSFEFKVFGTDNTWKPDDNVTVPGIQRGQSITFYFDSTTGAATYEITGTADAEQWPPEVIDNTFVDPSWNDTLIYNISGGSNNITTNKSTLDGLRQVNNQGKWWADFTDLLPTIGSNQLYFNITSNGNYTGFYSTSNSTIDLSDAPGVNAAKMTDNSGKYFVELSGIDSTVTNLGVYITKDGNNKFTYKVYTIKGSSSASKTVKIYAKDGAIRRLGTARDPRSNITYSTFEQHANTFLTDSTYNTRMTGAVRASTHGASGDDEWGTTEFSRYTYDYTTGVEKGSTIYIKTVLKNDDYMNQYYLAGYSINGTTYVEHTVAESQTGTVTESFTIPKDWEWNYVEITPIYFLRDSANTIKFYVEGYDQTVMDAGWGNTVGVYPYYQDPTNNSQVANINNPFGGYPGQPLMFYKGNYYAIIPKQYQAYTEAHTSGEKVNCEIKGVTLSNMYWDDVHLYTGEVSGHFQTYDFDDLYKIYKEQSSQVDNIICAFKYRTLKNNDEPSTVTPSNYTNGWELLKDYDGNPIDIFGNILKGSALATANAITTAEQAQNATNVVRVISQDYKSNCAGQYATEYAIYDTTGRQVKVDGGKSTIVPSALAIQSAAAFDKYDPATRAFKDIYSTLKGNENVLNQPVVITYEKSIYGGGDKADRCDARWFYSKRGASVNATTRIEYSDDLGATWNTDTFETGTATGEHTGSTAYFVGLSSDADNTADKASAGNTTTTDTSKNNNLDPRVGEGYYVFNATTGAQYEFVGWYILRENYQQNATKDHLTSHAEIAKDGDIFVARFVKTAHGSFTINHKLHPQSSGFGDVYVQATVKNSGNTLYTIGSVDPNNNPTSTVTIEKDGNDNDLIVSGHGNIIEAKFVPDPYGTSSFVNFYATVNDLLNGYNGYDFVKSIEINMPGVDGYDSSKGIYALVTYDVDKMFAATSGTPTQIYTSVTHYSKFDLKTDVHYNLKYTFTTRYYGAKNYEYSQSFTEAELRSYFYDQITQKSVTEITIDEQFVFSKAPNESNYRQDLTWRIGDVQIRGNTGTLTAYQVDKKTVDGIVYDSEIKNGQYGLVTKRMTTGYMKLFDTTTNATDQTAETFNPADENLYRPMRTTYLDNGEEKTVYLHHWNVYQLDSFTYDTTNSFDELGNLNVDTTKSKLVAQSYSSKFNYVGFEDYAIVPVYTSVYVNRQEISDSRTDSSATLLTITRNHWNNTTSGNADSGSYNQPNTNYDRLYVDFMLNYNYSKMVDGKLTNVLLNSTDENIKVGFVVKSYTVEDGHKVYREGKSQTVLVNKSKIDNKNRLEYCYGFNNTQNNSQWGLNFEFTPFIVDTNNPTGGTGASIEIDNTTYQALYPVDAKDVLDGVNFYVIGKADTAWS